MPSAEVKPQHFARPQPHTFEREHLSPDGPWLLSAWCGPACVHRLGGIRGDFEVRAVVIVEPAVGIHAVLRHELRDLQRAFLTVDIWEIDIGLKELGRTRRVWEQA